MNNDYYAGKKAGLERAIAIVYAYFNNEEERDYSSFTVCSLLKDEMNQMELPIKIKVVLDPHE